MNRLFWDIETCPNIGFFWRAGYKQSIPYENIIQERRIICVSYKWENEDKVHSLDWGKKRCDKALLQQFSKQLSLADEMVYHNGDKFDWPWINTRLIKHRLSPVIKPKSADTLAWARRLFYFNSNRLDYLGDFLLGEGKNKTQYEWWKEITLNNNLEMMRLMKEYCEKDVLLLQRIWEKLSAFGPVKTHASVLAGGEKWHSPHTGDPELRERVHLSKTTVTARGTRQYQMKCLTTGKYYTISETAHSAYVEAKK